MTIDYDKLAQELQEMNEGVHVTTRYTWADLATELLRLRDGVATVRDRCATLAGSAQAAGIRTFADETDITATALTGLLEGDAE